MRKVTTTIERCAQAIDADGLAVQKDIKLAITVQ
jgi:hypothetical protein